MKRIISIMLYVLILMSFVGCSESSKLINESESVQNNVTNALQEGPYVSRSADWPIYNDAKSLIDASNMVLIGKITDIEFQVLDSSNALPVSDTTKYYARELYTIYSLEILTTYKGDTANVSKIRVMGGMLGYKPDEQLKIMEDGQVFLREAGIPIWDYYAKAQCEIGETYLFVLYQFETGVPTILNLEQSVFNIDTPTLKRTIGNNSKKYYEGKKDEYNNPLISIQDIISTFGTDKWDDFQKNYQ